MLKWEEQMKIKFLVSRGHSIRETARLTGHARNTVRAVLRGKPEEKGTETRGRVNERLFLTPLAIKTSSSVVQELAAIAANS